MNSPRSVEFLHENEAIRHTTPLNVQYLACVACHLAREGTVYRAQVRNCTGIEENTIGRTLAQLEEKGVLTSERPQQPGQPREYHIADTQLGNGYAETIEVPNDCPESFSEVRITRGLH